MALQRAWLLALLLCGAAFAAGPLPRPEAGKLTVYFFDVGQGDAALVVSPTGKTVLVDAGPPESGRALGERLAHLVDGPIDLVVLTHPHLDHLGGLPRVLSTLGAKRFLDPGFDHPSSAYRRVLEQVADLSVQYLEPATDEGGGPMAIGLGEGASLTVLWPKRPAESFLQNTRSDANANSIVFRLTWGETSFLFTGDAEADTESRLLRSGQPLDAWVLKVAHHGSRHSNQAPFLARVSPKAAVISCGRGNEYRHPHGKALERLSAVGADVFRTDLDGDVVAVSDGSTIQLRSRLRPDRTVTLSKGSVRAALTQDPVTTVEPARAEVKATGWIASRNSEVFHLASCPNAQRIKEKNRLSFSTRAEASKKRRPAQDCHP